MTNPSNKEIWGELIRLREGLEAQRKETTRSFGKLLNHLSAFDVRIAKVETKLKIAGAIAAVGATGLIVAAIKLLLG